MIPSPPTWSAHTLQELKDLRKASEREYLEFLAVQSMNAGLYELAAGADDPQQPHDEDEVYYVISGRARFQVGNEDLPVVPGTVLYVAAGIEHGFHSITEGLSVLVVFSSG